MREVFVNVYLGRDEVSRGWPEFEPGTAIRIEAEEPYRFGLAQYGYAGPLGTPRPLVRGQSHGHYGEVQGEVEVLRVDTPQYIHGGPGYRDNMCQVLILGLKEKT